jgi:hypothetical protein
LLMSSRTLQQQQGEGEGHRHSERVSQPPQCASRLLDAEPQGRSHQS